MSARAIARIENGRVSAALDVSSVAVRWRKTQYKLIQSGVGEVQRQC